jgi:hypothetical protein
LDELAALEQSGAWPARLLTAYAEASAIAPPVATAPSRDELRLADITARIDVDDCRQWLTQFRALVEAHRERLQEW